jgi:hypothetical protein
MEEKKNDLSTQELVFILALPGEPAEFLVVVFPVENKPLEFEGMEKPSEN